jgi:hypothetical protein
MPLKRNFDLNEDFRRGMAEVEREMKLLGLQMVKDASQFLDDYKVNVDGTLKKSLVSEVDLFMNGLAARLVVGAGAKHAEWVHEGTKPRDKFPPVAPIRRWVKKKLAIADPQEIKRVAFLIARSIKERGTSMSAPGVGDGPRPKPFLDFALQKHQDKFASRMQGAFTRGFDA